MGIYDTGRGPAVALCKVLGAEGRMVVIDMKFCLLP